MKRLIPLLLLVPILAFGLPDRRKQSDPGPATTATLNLNTGEYITYGGSKAGQAQDTGSSKVAEALAGKVDADSEFAYVNLTRYAEDQPDVAIEQRLANNEKGAATQLAAAVSGGAPSAVIAGIQNVLTTAIKERADYEKAKANRPKPDTAGISITSFMNGPGSHAATAIMGAKFGDTLAAKTRSNYVLNNETVRTDTSNTNDYSGVSNVLRHQLELAKIDLEMAKIKAASVTPTKPPVVKPPVVEDEVDDDSPGEAPTSSVEYDKLPKKNFIYKTRLEKHNPVTRHDAAILIPKDRPAPVSIDGIGHEIVENYLSKSEDRWLLRTKGPLTGSAATLVVTYKDGSKESFKIKALNSRTEYAPGPYKKPTSTGPVDPPPSGNTSAAPAGGKTHELTSIGLLLRADVAATVSHVIVIEDAETNRENPPKIAATRIGNTWTTGKPLSQHRAAVYQVWFATPPPAPVTYHPDFLGRGPVGHVTQAGLWNPDTIR